MLERIYNAASSLVFAVVIFFISGCAGTPETMGRPTLDEAITTAAHTIGEELGRVSDILEEPAQGQTPIIAILNFSSPSEEISAYIIEELTLALAENSSFRVVERKQLDLIRQEENFHLSGEVSDDTAVSIGRKIGATHIVTGSLSGMNDVYRFRAWAIAVETAGIVAPVRLDVSLDHSPGPNRAEALLASGNAHLARKDYDKAIADYDAALRLNPGLSQAVTNRKNAVNAQAEALLASGNAHLARKDYDKAIADYDAALRLNPGLSQAVTNRQNAVNAQAEALLAGGNAHLENAEDTQAEVLVTGTAGFSTGDKVLVGFGNLFLGLGSFSTGDWGGGLTLAGGYAVAAGLIVYDIVGLTYDDTMAGIPGGIGLGIAGATAVYGFIRPFLYEYEGGTALLAVLDGVNIAVIPDTSGMQALHLSYSFQF